MITTSPSPITGPGLAGFSFPEDTALFAIGDVHGEAETLRALCEGLAAVDTGSRKRHVVFLGDAVDKGPASIDALDLLFNHLGALTRADEVTLLPGNHDLMMADAIEAGLGGTAADGGEHWLANGGTKVLLEVITNPEHRELTDETRKLLRLCHDYVGAQRAVRPLLERMPEILPEFLAALSARDIDFPGAVRAMPSHLRIGDALCVHAGVNPRLPLGVALNLPQSGHIADEDHWAWVRERFLASQRGWFEAGPGAWRGGSPAEGGVLILHGHTPPRRWGRFPSNNPERIASIFDRSATNARICLDFEAGSGVGVGACLVTSESRTIFFEPCPTL